MAVSDIPCHCIRLRRVTGAVDKIYDNAFSGTDITIGQFSLLYNIGALGESSVTVLADHVGLDRTTVVRSIKPLEDAGYVEDASAASARDRGIRLTETGKEKVNECIAPWLAAQEKAAALLGEDGLKLLERLVDETCG